jgi:surface polysaccharide O-acyltransferase-like enzyme
MTSSVNVPLHNLRGIVILIVVAFHSSLPYLASQPQQPYAFDAEPYRWIAFPIIDQERWFGFDLFCAWQDISLMPLMFFLAGLFAPASLGRKGPVAYLANRWWRIGLPFGLAVAVLSPLAYFASYCLTAADPSFDAFWQHWRALPMWPSGPQWFLWQVFVLSALSAGLYGLAPRWRHGLSRLIGSLSERPLSFVVGLAGLSVVGYVPLALAFSPWDWTNLGPFSFQQCRPLLYLVYFFVAFSVGSHGCDRSLLRIDGPVARYWLAWLAAAMICFAAWGGLTALTLPDWNASPLSFRLAAAFAFPFACASGVLAYLALALRFLRGRDRVLDQLSNHAYGIYLVHYVFVLWLQYALVGTPMSAPAKMMLVFGIATTLSWATSAGASAIVEVGVRKPRVPLRRPAAIPHEGAVAVTVSDEGR